MRPPLTRYVVTAGSYSPRNFGEQLDAFGNMRKAGAGRGGAEQKRAARAVGPSGQAA